MQNLKFTAINFRSELGEIQKNLDWMENWVSKLQSKGAQVIRFPEMSICGYSRSEAIIPHLQNISGSIVSTLREIAARYDVLILAGLATQNQHRERFISQVAVSPQGSSLFYNKVHLSPTEAAFYTPGRKSRFFLILAGRSACSFATIAIFPR
jgi:predicted amidohydrolase